jgi:hypothetical protein
MLHTAIHDGGTVIEGDLPAGASAYVDREWLPDTASGPVPAIVHLGGTLRWGDGSEVAAADADAAAFSALAAVAHEAAEFVQQFAPELIEVSGSGLVAREVRHLLRLEIVGEDARERPMAIVDTTGDPKVIEDATRRLADLGKLVLAGESLGRPFPLNLYSDVHARGLELIGVGPPLSQAPSDTPADPSRYEPPTKLAAGTVPPPGRWYRVVGPR